MDKLKWKSPAPAVVELPESLQQWLKRPSIKKRLTENEGLLLRHLLVGLSEKAISKQLNMPVGMQRLQVAELCAKWGVTTREELMASIFAEALKDLATRRKRPQR